MPVHILASAWSDRCQYLTQHAYSRPYCIVALLFAIDDEKGPQLYKVDPAGFFMGYKATASGEKEQNATNNLEKTLKKNISLTKDETVKTAIRALQEAIFLPRHYQQNLNLPTLKSPL